MRVMLPPWLFECVLARIRGRYQSVDEYVRRLVVADLARERSVARADRPSAHWDPSDADRFFSDAEAMRARLAERNFTLGELLGARAEGRR